MSRYTPRDRFYQRAHAAGYRSRGVFKLEDLLGRAPPLRRGDAVVELGCWPGGWLQVLAERVGPEGRVLGVDLEEVAPLGPPVDTLVLDVTKPEAPADLAERLGRPARLVVSDAAPKLSGVRDVDRAALEELYEAALAVALKLLGRHGALIVKAFPSPEADRFRKRLRQSFSRVSAVEPEGRRRSSKELYLVASRSR